MFSRCPRWLPVIAGVLGAVAGVSFVAAGPACPPTLALPTQDEVHAVMRDARDHGALWTIEAAGTQRKALSGGPPGQRLAALERATASLEQGNMRPAIRALAKAWQDGDLVTIADFEQWSGSASSPEAKADVERMVFGRNPDLAAAIDRTHREGKRVVAAAGILHMVGDGGLPKLLQKLGYKVESGARAASVEILTRRPGEIALARARHRGERTG